jgi:putative heme-binding domain-containing protein
VAGFALDEKQPLDVRQEAVRTLSKLHSPEATAALESLLPAAIEKKFPALATEAIGALGEQSRQRADQASGKAAREALQKLLLSTMTPPEMKPNVLLALVGSKQGALWLLEQKERKELPDSLVADAGRLLRNVPYQDLKPRINQAFPVAGRIDPKKLPSIEALAKKRGDADRGRELMAASAKNDMQCMKCHSIRGQGGNIGPDLSLIGKKGSRENLLESILYPSKAIADQYLTWVIDTRQGQSLSGLIVEETPEHITLRDGNGKDTKILRKDIDTRVKSPNSLMPTELVASMTEPQLLDVVEYLLTLKTAATGMDYWHIVGPFPNGSNDAGLDKALPPESGIDLKATYQGKNGPVTWKTVRPDHQNYFDLQAFFSPASTDIVSYLYRGVESPVEQEATILLGHDDAAKLWVNGTLVHTNRNHDAAKPEAHRVKVKLKKGKNELLLKITNGNNPHGFYFTILSEQELKRVEEK